MRMLPSVYALCLGGMLLCASGFGARGEAAELTSKSASVQIRLAEEMAENEDWDETARRWIDVLFYFGPSDQEARADFELGAVALQRGRSDLAVAQWRKVIARYPESEWTERAQKALQILGGEMPEPATESPAPYVTEQTPEDERQFLVSDALMAQGLYAFAVRDFLKVTNLYPDSPRAPEARFRIGTCQALLGRPELAMEQWQRVSDDYPESPQAAMARNGIAAWKAMLTTTGLARAEVASDAMAAWRPFRDYGSEVDRGLSYAEDLYENGRFVYALQEYAKVLCDIYTSKGEANSHRDYARYRMGVCAYRLGHWDAAARQWRRLTEDAPGSQWATHANAALASVAVTDPFSSDASLSAQAVPASLPTGLMKRYHLAAQLRDCELPEVAIKEYLKILYVLTPGRSNPLQAEASYLVGVCQHLDGRADLAVAAWRQTIEAYPETEWAAKAETSIQQTNRRETALAVSQAAKQE